MDLLRPDSVPNPAARRLSLYLRQLDEFRQSGRQTVSSKELGQALQLTDAQVRKDLAYFGQFGHPGVGYPVEELINRLKRILGTDRKWNAVVIGAGNLGRALLQYRGFGEKGFELVAVFDADPQQVGRQVDRLVVQPMDLLRQTVQQMHVKLGILAIPAAAAQKVADELVASGVRGLLNFAPVSLKLPEGVAVSSVDLALALEQLVFQVSLGAVDPPIAEDQAT